MVPKKDETGRSAGGRGPAGSSPGDASGIPDGAAFGESPADAHPTRGASRRESQASQGRGGRKTDSKQRAASSPHAGKTELHPDEAAAGGAAFGDAELIEDLGAELELAQRQANEHLELAKRVQAEFENYRKRMQREQADAIARAGQRIVEELLPAIDNLERAIDHAVTGGEVSSDLLKGVELVHSQILGVLGKEGVEVDDPFGRHFDPLKEQAVGQREDTEVPEGTVVDVYQKGYVMAGKVIRPAMVVVSTGGPQRTEE